MTELAKWVWMQVLVLFGLVEIKAGFAGLVLGVVLTDFIPRMLPASMNADYATRLTRLIVFASAMLSSFALNPTLLGFVIALTVGAGSASVQSLAMRVLYARFPSLRPASLTQCLTDKPAPRSLVK